MRYYFYTLNKVEYPEDKILNDVQRLEGELLEKASKTNDPKEKAWYLHGVMFGHEVKHDRYTSNKKYELQNGQDIRFFSRYGVKETDEEGYNQIVEDDKRIVKSFNEKTLRLLSEFNQRTDGWHFPFYVDAESKSHLRWILNKMFPEYDTFILNK